MVLTWVNGLERSTPCPLRALSNGGAGAEIFSIFEQSYSQEVKFRATRHFEGLKWDLELFAFRPAEAMDGCLLM